eukprot:360519-Chlamydomonas_euryale.AAC.4
MTVSGTDLLVFGGWIYTSGEKGDLFRLSLVLDDEERRMGLAAAHAAEAAAGVWVCGEENGVPQGYEACTVHAAPLCAAKILRVHGKKGMSGAAAQSLGFLFVAVGTGFGDLLVAVHTYQ